MFTDPTRTQLASLIYNQSLSNLQAGLGQSLVSASTPETHHQYDPSPGLKGAAPPLLIVLKTEYYQDLISPGLPAAGFTNVKEILRGAWEGGTKESSITKRNPCFCQMFAAFSFKKCLKSSWCFYDLLPLRNIIQPKTQITKFQGFHHGNGAITSLCPASVPWRSGGHLAGEGVSFMCDASVQVA